MRSRERSTAPQLRASLPGGGGGTGLWFKQKKPKGQKADFVLYLPSLTAKLRPALDYDAR